MAIENLEELYLFPSGGLNCALFKEIIPKLYLGFWNQDAVNDIGETKAKKKKLKKMPAIVMNCNEQHSNHGMTIKK